MKKLQRTLLAAAAGLCFAGGASATVIDLFDDPPGPPPNIQEVVDSTVDATSVSNEYPGGAVPSTTILGGYRDLIVKKVSGAPSGNSKLNVADGSLNFSNDAGANPVVGTAIVQWDGKDLGADKSVNQHALGANLKFQDGCDTVIGCELFQAQVLFADQGFDYDIKIYSGAANYTTLTALSQFAVNASNTEVADYYFSWFGLAATTGNIVTLQNVPLNAQGRCTTSGLTAGVGGNYYCEDGLAFLIAQAGTGANFQAASAIEFQVNNVVGTTALDLSIGSFTKTNVPEPGTLALVGASLLGLAGMRRRRQG